MMTVEELKAIYKKYQNKKINKHRNARNIVINPNYESTRLINPNERVIDVIEKWRDMHEKDTNKHTA